MGLDVVEQVVPDDGARLDTERVEGAHVAQHPAANVVGVVELDDIVPGQGPSVAPGPADRDRRVVGVVDVVVGDPVASALPDPDADGRGIDDPDVVDVAVGEDVPARLLRLLSAHPGLADLHAARAQVRHFAAGDPVLLAAAGEFDGVLAQVQEAAVLDAA